MNQLIRWTRRAALIGAALIFGGTASAQEPPKPALALNLTPLSGQKIPVLPSSYVVSDTGTAVPSGRAALLAWTDSIIGETLQARGPEVQWLLPPALRLVARRAPATVTNPDRMGQAVLRSSNMDKVPDPLRVYMRSLAALTNSRLIMTPAAVRFTRVATGVRAEVDLVLADVRSGAVAWRSRPAATAPEAGEALAKAIATIIPDVD